MNNQRFSSQRSDNEPLALRLAREIIREHMLTKEHLNDDGRVGKTLYHKFSGYVIPHLNNMKPSDLARVASYGIGLHQKFNKAMNVREQPHNGEKRTTMLEVHGYSRDWIPCELEGRDIIKTVAITVVIASIHDQLGGDCKAIVPQDAVSRRVAN